MNDSYHFRSTRMPIIKKKKRQKQVLADNVERLELMCIAGRNTKVYTRYEKQYGVSSEN